MHVRVISTSWLWIEKETETDRQTLPWSTLWPEGKGSSRVEQRRWPGGHLAQENEAGTEGHMPRGSPAMGALESSSAGKQRGGWEPGLGQGQGEGCCSRKKASVVQETGPESWAHPLPVANGMCSALERL